MKYSNLLIILTVLGLLTVGCDGEQVDLVSPTMEILQVDPVPNEDLICGSPDPMVFHLTGGDSLFMDMVFSDNEALSQYKIDIHSNFDCHGHQGGNAPSVTVPNTENETQDLSILDIRNISGASSRIVRILNIPDNVTAGNYHFQIQVIDESGNDNPLANYFALKVLNPLDNVIPEIGINIPATDSFSAKKGQSIQFEGTVTDNLSLSDGGNGVLWLSYTDLQSGNTFATNVVYPFDEETTTQFNFNFNYTIPQTLTPGNYRITLGATDGVRNVAEFKSFNVEVTN